MSDTLEERYRRWIEIEAPLIDAEGLLGGEIKSLTPHLKRGVPTLSGREVRQACEFPVHAGAAARINESATKLGYKRAPEGKNINALPVGKGWHKPRDRMPAPWGKGQPKGGRWSKGKRVLAPRDPGRSTEERVEHRQKVRRAWEAQRKLDPD